MTDRFDACLAEVLRQEGGYADNPADPGGATNMGITRKTLAGWRKVTPWTLLPKTAVQQLTETEAAAIYKAQYWQPVAGDELPAGLDLAVFDFAVHSGPQRAVKTLQKLTGVPADGIVGPVTLSGIKQKIALMGLAGLIDAFCDERLDFLTGLAAFAVFGSGWRKRVSAIRAAALAAAGTTSTDNRRETMTLITGYKTYIVAAAMLLAGVAQVLGIDIPSMEGHSAGQLILEAFAVIFLRREIKTGF
jgi:lysozyme family protein